TYRNSVFDSIFFFSSRRRHTRFSRDWSSDVCSSDLVEFMFFLLHFKKAGFITCILDEIDEIFPAACQGIRWHMQALFADSAKDRSEERRVGKECRSRWAPKQEKISDVVESS